MKKQKNKSLTMVISILWILIMFAPLHGGEQEKVPPVIEGVPDVTVEQNSERARVSFI